MDDLAKPAAFRARYVLPVDAPPIRDGFVTLDGSRIVSVGPGPPGCAALDLGDVAILPGLVNAHTHLEFSDLRSPLGAPSIALPAWIASVIAHRRQNAAGDPQATAPPGSPASTAASTAGELRAARAAVVDMGLAESLAAGVTTLAEIATGQWSSDPFDASPLDMTVFHELLSPGADRIDDQLAAADECLARAAGARWRAGLSPHAPYTVHWQLLERAVRKAQDAGLPLTMHLAESLEELELLAAGSGPLVQLLQDLNAWYPGAIPRGVRPLEYLEILAAAPRALVVHGNYLDDEEIRFLGQHAQHMSVVYCPRTHAYFGHGRWPLEELLAAGANVALGTDSRASNPDLSLLAELRFVARRYPQIPPAEILRIGTLRGAAALGLDSITGSITPGKRADLAIVALPGSPAADPYEALFAEDTPLVNTLCAGRWLADPGSAR